MQSSKEIRQQFLDFFKEKGHKIVPSAPIVVKDDPTLMFTNAGMNPFKDIFLDLKKPESPRVADTQKCLRVSGKHNDLEEVGHDTYHHTMFEMLGNWSFGDYYKEEAIEWAWELLTKVYGMDESKLYVTIFGGEDGVGADEEAAEMWKKWIPEERILRFGKKDNFWEMGDVGPCGPCSEIHIDLRSDEDKAKRPGAEMVNADHPEVIEIWNLVFIQFNRKADGSLENLPATHVDTGMGFERLCLVLQDKISTYDTDVFDATRSFLEKKSGKTYAQSSQEIQIAMRVIMDHIRAIVFTIADGQIPSNTGAGYVIRRILRRASRYGFTYLNFNQPFMYEMVELLAAEYDGVFPEVNAQKDFIKRIIEEEEKGFLNKLERGTNMFEDYVRTNPDSKQVNGVFAFKLYDTFGFPIDLTQLMAREKGLEVDMKGFDEQLQLQKERSRKAGEVKTGDWVIVNQSEDLPVFVGYDTLTHSTRILQYRSIQQKKKKAYQIVLEETPFYAESGGQIGDKGTLTKGDETIHVVDTKRENELIVHFVNKLPEDAAGEWVAEVKPEHRRLVRANHSATHLLHAALRNHLGTHVEQRGSLVSDKVLRFDFSHFAKVTDEELATIEAEVNNKIAEAIPLTEFRDIPISEAKEMGAMALFGEKYGERVRTIVFDPNYSVELCGGIHVPNTSEIRFFKIVSEGSVAAGIRRVEAYTSDTAMNYIQSKLQLLERIELVLKNPKETDKAVNELVEENKKLEKELQQLNEEKVLRLKDELVKQVEQINGVNVLRQVVAVSSGDDLRTLSFDLKRTLNNSLIVLGTEAGGKALLSVIVSDDLQKDNRFHAGKIIRELAKEIRGGGGGQPFFATAGGKDATGLPKAMEKVADFL